MLGHFKSNNHAFISSLCGLLYYLFVIRQFQYLSLPKVIIVFEFVLCHMLQAEMLINRQDQLRGKNEVGYQHKCRAESSAGIKGAHEGQPDTSVDPHTSSIPSRLVLL